MGAIAIEGEPAGELPRAAYDLRRPIVGAPAAVCFAPFGSLHVGSVAGQTDGADAAYAPCRHASLAVGTPDATSLAEAFEGDAMRALRDRFRHYVVRRNECGGCIRHWEDGAGGDSPAVADFDRALPPVNGLPPTLRTVSVQADALLPEARVDQLIALLPSLSRLDVLCDATLPGPLGRRLLDAADALPAGRRPAVRVLAHGVLPDARALPTCVTGVEVELPLRRGGLSASGRTALTGLVAQLAALGATPLVRTAVGRGDWLELKSWLAEVIACGATPVVTLKPRDDPDSLAALDGDALSTLHGVLYRWSVEVGVARGDAHGAASFSSLLQRVRTWQRQASDRVGGATWAVPPLDHPLLADESEARHLLQEFLRIYHHVEVERWLASLAFDPAFVGGARERCSLRLVALWLACVFERDDVWPLLRSIYENATAAARRIAADRASLAGGELARWHDDWVRALEIEKAPRGPAPFTVPAAAPPARGARARPRAPARASQLTVVIPSYNHERFVGAAIDSVLAQTGVEVRVLVVDDGSKDGTVAAAKSRDDARLTVRSNEQNLGLGESLWRALKSVRTPYVAVLNSDDLFHPERLAKCLAALRRKPEAAVVASFLVPVDGDGRACGVADTSPILDGKRVHDWLHWFETNCRGAEPARDLVGQLLQGNFLITSSNLVCRRDWLLDHAGLWRDLEFCVDWQLFLAAALEGRLRVVPEPLLAYRLHASNTVWFDEERAWRFYVESHRVIARALESMVASKDGGGGAAARFARVLEAVAGPLAHNGAIDWAGVYLGLLLERLDLPSAAMRDEASRGWWKTLERLRELKLRERDIVAVLGDDVSSLLRMRGEQPYLRSTRNRLEAVADELERVRSELQGALQERQKTETLWHSAEIDRDREIADKAHLYGRIGELESDLDRERRESTQKIDATVAELRALEQTFAQLRARTNAEVGAAHAAAERRLELERSHLVELVEVERKRLQALAAEEREAQAQALAAAARERELHGEQERAKFEAELAATQAIARRNAQDAAALREAVDERARERDEVRRTPEFRVGNLLLNKLRLKRPLRAVEKRFHKARVTATRVLLGAERRGLIHGSGARPRVFATVCWNFPIYSQTFVYQELLQLTLRGFDLRLIYSKLDSREYLHQQFAPLWKLKRTMHLDRAIHGRDYMYYKARFPDRVEQVTNRLCAASGLSRERLIHHDNFLQGFTYARLAEAWGADYLHSYFFYDRSLMSLIASFVLGLPRGVTCYADHLLADYELKVVPLHLETAEIVIATSNRIKRELLALAPATDPEKIVVKPNAIDCTRFPVLPRSEPSEGQPHRIVVTSRIEPKKGLIYLVEAMKLLRDEGVNVECHVVGDADRGVPASENYKDELCDRITRHGLGGKVHLEGRQNLEGVRRFLSISQLFVAPFVETESGDKDGIPTALVEALATGIPCVVTDSGSMLEVVEDGIDARVVRQRDPRALADAIRTLLADPDLRRVMGHAAAQKAREKFDVSVCEPLLHDRIRAVLKRSGR